jgi:hypothetical protein
MRRPARNLPLLLSVTSIGLAVLAPACGRRAAVEVAVARVEDAARAVAGPWRSLKDLQDGAAIRVARR